MAYFLGREANLLICFVLILLTIRTTSFKGKELNFMCIF
jgi:hypothetical protein